MECQEVVRHTYCFNKEANGGEQLILLTKMFDNGDATDNIYFNQELSLQSHFNEAVFNLCYAIDPKELRDLANVLDSTESKALANITNNTAENEELAKTHQSLGSLVVETIMTKNVYGDLNYAQKLTLYSHGDNASLVFTSAVIDSEKCRDLANQLDSLRAKHTRH